MGSIVSVLLVVEEEDGDVIEVASRNDDGRCCDIDRDSDDSEDGDSDGRLY
jgi:hypothetical protein